MIAAARVAATARGGEIHVSDVVRQLVSGKEYWFQDLGEQELRGLGTRTRVYALSWEA